MPVYEISPSLTIHYRDHNPSGSSTVLLLHGLGATGDSWQLQIPALTTAGYRVIAPDARGFGQSTYPGGGMSIADIAGDVAALLQYLGIDSAHVIGISMGGTIAQQLTLDHPEMVDKLVLVNTFARLKPDNASQFFYFLLRMVLVHTLGIPKQAQAVTKRLFPQPEQEEFRQQLYDQIVQADPSGYRAAMRALARFNVEKRLHEIPSPTLVVTGENDTTVGPQRQQLLAQSIPNVQQVVIPGAGHPVTVSHHDAFNKLLLNFLAG